MCELSIRILLHLKRTLMKVIFSFLITYTKEIVNLKENANITRHWYYSIFFSIYRLLRIWISFQKMTSNVIRKYYSSYFFSADLALSIMILMSFDTIFNLLVHRIEWIVLLELSVQLFVHWHTDTFQHLFRSSSLRLSSYPYPSLSWVCCSHSSYFLITMTSPWLLFVITIRLSLRDDLSNWITGIRCVEISILFENHFSSRLCSDSPDVCASDVGDTTPYLDHVVKFVFISSATLTDELA